MPNSQTPSYTPFKHTTSEILWAGGDVECLGICNGIPLTQLETEIVNKVCELQTLTDASNIILPECLVIAWQTRDKTVLEFIKFLLDSYCSQQNINTDLETQINNVNPVFTLSYCCCNDEDGCDTQVELTLTSHLQKILNCICEQSNRITELTEQLSNYVTSEQLAQVNGRIDCLREALVQFNIANSATVEGFQGIQLNQNGCN